MYSDTTEQQCVLQCKPGCLWANTAHSQILTYYAHILLSIFHLIQAHTEKQESCQHQQEWSQFQHSLYLADRVPTIYEVSTRQMARWWSLLFYFNLKGQLHSNFDTSTFITQLLSMLTSSRILKPQQWQQMVWWAARNTTYDSRKKKKACTIDVHMDVTGTRDLKAW